MYPESVPAKHVATRVVQEGEGEELGKSVKQLRRAGGLLKNKPGRRQWQWLEQMGFGWGAGGVLAGEPRGRRSKHREAKGL
jgi:hypothetical protein